MKSIFTNTLRHFTRILYKYWVIGVLWFVWEGLYKVIWDTVYIYYDRWFAVFLVITGLGILYSELKYIMSINQDRYEL